MCVCMCAFDCLRNSAVLKTGVRQMQNAGLYIYLLDNLTEIKETKRSMSVHGGCLWATKGAMILVPTLRGFVVLLTSCLQNSHGLIIK